MCVAASIAEPPAHSQPFPSQSWQAFPPGLCQVAPDLACVTGTGHGQGRARLPGRLGTRPGSSSLPRPRTVRWPHLWQTPRQTGGRAAPPAPGLENHCVGGGYSICQISSQGPSGWAPSGSAWHSEALLCPWGFPGVPESRGLHIQTLERQNDKA